MTQQRRTNENSRVKSCQSNSSRVEAEGRKENVAGGWARLNKSLLSPLRNSQRCFEPYWCVQLLRLIDSLLPFRRAFSDSLSRHQSEQRGAVASGRRVTFDSTIARGPNPRIHCYDDAPLNYRYRNHSLQEIAPAWQRDECAGWDV